MLAVNPFTEAIHAATTVASTALADLSALLAPVGGAAVAIVVLTLAVRLAVHPLHRVSARAERVRARLAPRVTEIRARHADDLVRAGEQIRDLYRSERVSPWASMLPLLVQAPVFLVLYHVFATSRGGLNTATLLGVPLHAHVLTATGGLGAHLLVFGLLLTGLTAVATVVSRRAAMLARLNLAAGTVATATGVAEIVAKVGQFAPYLVLISGVVLPLAAGLYLLTTTAWSAAENVVLRRGLPH